MINSPAGFRGEVTIELWNSKDGTRVVHNKVVNGGLKYSAARWLDNNTNPISHVAIGTDDTAAAAGQTALVAEVGTRAAVTGAVVTRNVTDDAVQYVATFPPGNPVGAVGIKEMGLFNASSAGTMVARTAFPVVNKGVDDGITVTWKVWGESL